MKYINKNKVEFIENKGDILASKYYHSFAYPNGVEAIGDCGAERIDNKEWDVFYVHYETKDAYYGIPMLGMGLMDCMILKSDTRKFSELELQYFNGKTLGLKGSHTGKMSPQQWTLNIEPIVDKYI